MKKIVPLLLVLALIQLVSCNSDKKQNNTTPGASDAQEVDSLVFSEYSSDSVTHFTFEVRIPNIQSFEPEINDSVNKQLTLPFSYTVSKGGLSNAEYIQVFKDSLYSEYSRTNEEFPEYAASYEWMTDAELLHISSTYISGVSRTYTYTGGAHGGRATSYFVLDRKTGKRLSRIDIVSDTTALNKLAEKVFRKNMEIAPNADLTESGFWFAGNTFYLNENFGFSKDGKSLIFLFYEYEVAAYAAGEIEMEIPLSELNGILKIGVETNPQ